MNGRIGALVIVLAALPCGGRAEVSFANDIQPLLNRHCVVCHGEAIQQSGLRLDRRDAAMTGGASEAIIKPGHPGNSKLIHRLEGRDGLVRMPPAAPLPEDEIELFRAWIREGAVWDSVTNTTKAGHWSFQPIERPAVPGVRDRTWVRNPIDAFVLARLEREGIAPAPEAEPEVLLRRAFLDLTGLPPDLPDMRAAAEYERLVDRLLRSEHFGERWASLWLDQVRYADSDGYEKDTVRPYAWRYRHWVIDALNRDMPFDQFTIEQIAGDLLPSATTEQRVATGFYRNTLKNREGGVNVEEFRFEEVVDRANTVATVWLGLSMECARCHDHKYDPVTQKDYYRLFAFFNELDEVDIDAPLGGELGPYLRAKPAFDRDLQAIYAKYKVRELQRPWTEKMLWAGENPGVEYEWDTSWDILALYLDDGQRILRTPEEQRDWREDLALTEWFLRNYSRVTSDEEYDATRFREAVKEVHALIDALPDVSRARAVQVDARPAASHVHPSGTWDDLGEAIAPGTPAALAPLDYRGPAPTRLDLARWLVSSDNPLTARVVANRIWQAYFGVGLAANTDNLGMRGEAPSHPALLDWLAAELIDSGWSLKRIHRLIVTSATYRQSSEWREDLAERDPANRLLARQARLRLPAESVRDASLAVAGLLDRRVGGPSVRPHQPSGVAELGYANSVEWSESVGSDRYRRGIYILFQRTTPYPFLANFDLEERNVTMCSRERSNTPLQALNLLNDPVFFEMAQGLAFRVLSETPGRSFEERLAQAYRVCLAREPRPSEQVAMRDYFIRQRTLLEEDEDATREWFPLEPGSAGWPQDRTALAAWVGLSRILLNLDEFITRE